MKSCFSKIVVVFSLIFSQQIVASTADERQARLGQGYIKNAVLPLSKNCLVDMPIVLTGQPSSHTFLNKNVEVSKIAELLNINANSKLGWEKFSIETNMQYLQDMQDDSYSTSYTLVSTILASARLNNDDFYGLSALRPAARQALEDSQAAFFRRCGDSYLESADIGASLFVTLKMHFRDQLSKQEFEAKMEGEIKEVGKFSTQVKTALNSVRGFYDVELVAHQIGGQPSNLNQIFGDESEHTVLHCSAANIDQCTKAFDNVLDYAQSRSPWTESGFSKQVKFKDGKIEADTVGYFNITSANVSTYAADFGVATRVDSLDPVTRQARLELNHLYDENFEGLKKIENIVGATAFSRLDLGVRQQLRTVLKQYRENLGLFDLKEVMACFDQAQTASCSNTIEQLKQQIVSPDLMYAKLLDEAYYFNINEKYPFIIVSLPGGKAIYSTSLVPAGMGEANFDVIGSSDFRYMVLKGTYRVNPYMYYLDAYGARSYVWRSATGPGYKSYALWNACTNYDRKCLQSQTMVEIIPF